MGLKYFNAVNALALPPDLQVILHSRLLTKIMQGNNSLNNSRCPKIQDIGAKMLLYEFFLIFISQDKRYITQAARTISHEWCLSEYNECKCDFTQQFSK